MQQKMYFQKSKNSDDFKISFSSNIKSKMSKLSSYMRLNRIWSSNNLPVAFIVFSAVLMPVFTVSLDMFYSDTQVILQLWQYINTIMGTDNLTMIEQIQQILPI